MSIDMYRPVWRYDPPSLSGKKNVDSEQKNDAGQQHSSHWGPHVPELQIVVRDGFPELQLTTRQPGAAAGRRYGKSSLGISGVYWEKCGKIIELNGSKCGFSRLATSDSRRAPCSALLIHQFWCNQLQPQPKAKFGKRFESLGFLGTWKGIARRLDRKRTCTREQIGFTRPLPVGIGFFPDHLPGTMSLQKARDMNIAMPLLLQHWHFGSIWKWLVHPSYNLRPTLLAPLNSLWL